MINWDDIRDIHVIKKLEEILSSWFSTTIILVDENGEIKNIEKNHFLPGQNLLCQLILQSPNGMDFLTKFTENACNQLHDSDDNVLTIEGPLPFTHAIVSSIKVDREFSGAVIAWPHLKTELTNTDKENAIREFTKQLSLNEEELKKSIDMLHTVKEHEIYYLKELVELVGQEIETFHQEITSREDKINALNKELGIRYRYDSMIGKSKLMQELYLLLDRIRHSDSTVMINGKNGTGKELIAKAIHFNSNRKDHPMMSINCSAFNENLLDSELFGHIRGAFTGATKDKKGLFEAANKGTMFLDEIGDMSPSMQVKLLRVFQEKTVLPVGSTTSKKVDVRVVTATNKNLKQMLENGSFREDLYYRINVINIQVPPLRDRKDDIPLLIDFFVERGCKEKNYPNKIISKKALEKMLDYEWPGNIRELENEIEKLLVLSGTNKNVPAELLSQRIRNFGEKPSVQGVRLSGKLKDALEKVEMSMIQDGLKRTNWNKSRLAKELGISRAGLIMKVNKYELDKRKFNAAQEELEGEKEISEAV